MIERILKFILILIGTFVFLNILKLYPKPVQVFQENWLLVVLTLILISYRYIDKLTYKIKSILTWDIYLYFKPEWVNGIFLGLLIFLVVSGTVSQFFIWSILKIYVLLIPVQVYIYYKPMLEENNGLSLPSTESFYQIIGKTQPIDHHSEDRFNVSKWVNKVADLLQKNRDSQLIIGINGKWGSGKTSLIHLIIKDLPKNSYLIFSSWNYLNNTNLSEHLMARIGSQLDQLTKKNNFFSKIFNSVNLSVSNSSDIGFSVLYKATFNLFSNDAKKNLNRRLKRELSYPLIVFIDDLDRLDKNEFMNVIRTIFILSDLTNIRFVLAYDKHHVLNLLFPDNDMNKSIDFFSKLINFEFNLNTHSEMMRRVFCIDIILKLQKFFPTSKELKSFELFFRDDQSAYYLFKLLETPRELRKVLALSVWSTLDSNGNFILNPEDMFVLTVIQHRIPKLYKIIQENVEEIKSELCTVLRISQLNYAPSLAKSKKGTETRDTEELLNELFGLNTEGYSSNEIKIITDLLKKLFSPLFHPDVYANTDEILKEKRICYPPVFENYLHLEANNFSIQYNQLIDAFKSINFDNQNEVIEFFHKNKTILNEHRIWNDFLEYNLYQEDPKQIESFLKGLFTISKKLESDEVQNLGTEVDIYSTRACQLVIALVNKEYTNEQLIELIKNLVCLQPSYGMYSFLIHNIKNPNIDLLNSDFSVNQDEIEKLDTTLLGYAKDYFFNDKKEFNKYDFCGLIYWTDFSDELKEKTLELIQGKQVVLFWLLDFFFRFSTSKSVYLDETIGLTNISSIIKNNVNFNLLSENEKRLIKNFNKQYLANN